MRERLLEDAERKLEARINELKGLEAKAEAASQGGAGREVAALKNLVTMYESMKPKDAARVFDRLAHDVLVSVVLQINPRKMAEVLAAMTPEAAEKLTVALAGRAHLAAAPPAPAAPGDRVPAAPRPLSKPLSRSGEGLRTAVSAMRLGEEALALDRLRAKFSTKMADSRDKRTFGFLTRPNALSTRAFREVASGVTSADTLAGFLAEYRKRYPEAAVAARRREASPAMAPTPAEAQPPPT